MKTLGAILERTNFPLKIHTLETPKLKPGQVLVKIHYSGLCHTQLNELRGKKGPDHFLPHTMGHEGSGEVIEVGTAVTKVKPGDSVVLTWLQASGQCEGGITYKSNNRVVNSGPISTFLNHAVVSENRLVKIQSSFPKKEAALLGCALPTGGGMVLNDLKIKRNDSLAIFGLGGIGTSALMIAKSLGAYPIFAIDVQEDKLFLAKTLGATHIINSTEVDPLKIIQEQTEGHGVKFSLEAVGNPQVMELAFKSVENKGGLCVLAGNVPIHTTIQIDPFDLIKGKQIRGSWGGATNPDKDIPRYIEWVKNGHIPLQELITHEFSLSNINDACNLLESGRTCRTIIKMEHS